MPTFTCHFKDNNESYLQEMPGMEKPVRPAGYEVMCFCNECDQYRYDISDYETHLSSLRTYPCPSLKIEWDGRHVDEGEFELQWQLQDFISGKEKWTDCDEHSYNSFASMKRIIAIPLEIKCVSDTPKLMVKSNPNYKLGTPETLQDFARICWMLIYGSLRDAQEKGTQGTDPSYMDYLIEVYRIAFKLMTGEDSKHIHPDSLPAASQHGKGQEDDGMIIEFLLGEKSFNGLWFDDKKEGAAFWWRKHLREYLSRPIPVEEVEKAAKEYAETIKEIALGFHEYAGDYEIFRFNLNTGHMEYFKKCESHIPVNKLTLYNHSDMFDEYIKSVNINLLASHTSPPSTEAGRQEDEDELWRELVVTIGDAAISYDIPNLKSKFTINRK